MNGKLLIALGIQSGIFFWVYLTFMDEGIKSFLPLYLSIIYGFCVWLSAVLLLKYFVKPDMPISGAPVYILAIAWPTLITLGLGIVFARIYFSLGA
ncbi:MAG: hypothetical protein ACI8O8_002845 [Oleiphilaceae bacterium]|jgi:hypothetical protein